jgi:hypothetical protein
VTSFPHAVGGIHEELLDARLRGHDGWKLATNLWVAVPAPEFTILSIGF